MNGRRLVKKTTKTLLKAMIIMLMFVAIGVGTYKLTLAYYKSTGQYASLTSSDNKTIAKATLDTVAVNAIFSVDGDSGKAKHIVLEIFHSDTGKINFVTVPVNSQYGMSKELYSTICKENPNVPQIVAWEDLPQYFSQVSAYQYGSLLLEEYLGIHVSFYTLMPESEFMQYFEETEAEALSNEGSAIGYSFNEATRNKIKGLTTSLLMEAELVAYYTKIQSNLSLSRRNTYISSYLKADYNNIGVYTLPISADTNETTEQMKVRIRQLVKN